jgi:hypothetical protein
MSTFFLQVIWLSTKSLHSREKSKEGFFLFLESGRGDYVRLIPDINFDENRKASNQPQKLTEKQFVEFKAVSGILTDFI